jgi:hypothetical protein
VAFNFLKSLFEVLYIFVVADDGAMLELLLFVDLLLVVVAVPEIIIAPDVG